MSRARTLLARLRARGADARDASAHAIADGGAIDVELTGFDATEQQQVLRLAQRALFRSYMPGAGLREFMRCTAGHPDFDNPPRAVVAPAALLAAIAERILPSIHD